MVFQFEGDFPTDPDIIMRICDILDIKPSKIHPDGTVDIDGVLDITTDIRYYFDNERNPIFKRGRLPLKFGDINGNCYINNCLLTTLEGSPHTVRGDFFAGANEFTVAYPLVELFSGPWINNFEKFVDSLVFNYIRNPIPFFNQRGSNIGKGQCFVLNLFRFKEALEDAEISLEEFGADHKDKFYSWYYMDDNGKRVDFNGKPLLSAW